MALLQPAAPDRRDVEGAMVATPRVLIGEIHNFSTEARWLGLMAHVVRDEGGVDPEVTQYLVSER